MVSAVLLALALLGAITAGAAPAKVVKQTTLLGYTQQGVFNYAVTMKPSSLYGTAPAAPPAPSQYPAALVDTVDFTFKYTSTDSSAASGRAEAVLGNQGVWQKTIQLGAVIESRELTMNFTLNPGQMEKMYNNIEKQLNITSSPHIVTINAYADTASTHFVQSLSLKIDKSLVTIDNSNLRQTQSGATGTMEYMVHLNAGVVPVTSAGFMYPAAIADRIDFTYKYGGLGQAPAKVNIEAVLENPGIWQQKIPLIPVSANPAQSASLNFSLDLVEINQKFSDIEKALAITPESRNVTVNASISTANANYVQSLPMTLSSSVIDVGGNLSSDQTPFSGQFDYSVHLKDNNVLGVSILKPTTSTPVPAPILSLDTASTHSPPLPAIPKAVVLGPGNIIYAKLVDQVKVSFLYQFKADQPVNNLKADVVVTALLEAPKVWSRTFTLLQTSESGNFNINLPLDVAGYRDLADTIGTETGASAAEYDLTITARVHSTGETQYGKIDETYSQDLKGVLKGGTLEWNKDLSKTQPGGIKTTQITDNSNKYLGLPLSAAKTLFLILAVIFLLLTALVSVSYFRNRPVSVPTTDKKVLELKKKYGQRMAEAGVNSIIDIAADSRNVLTFNSMEDLIKIADELAKPIIYQEPGPNGELCVCFVLDGTTRYQYLLRTGFDS